MEGVKFSWGETTNCMGVSCGVCEAQGIAGYQIEIQCHVHGHLEFRIG